MSTQATVPQIDYDALAAQARAAKPATTAAPAAPAAAAAQPSMPPSPSGSAATPSRHTSGPAIDYDALAQQARQAKPVPDALSASSAPSSSSVPSPAVTATISAVTPSTLSAPSASRPNEGTYAMTGQDGKTIQIPYSKIRGYDDPYSKSASQFRTMSDLGYHFASEQEQARFLKDLAADPIYGNEGYGNGLIGWLHAGGNDLTVGALREGAKTIVGLTSLANKAANSISTHLTGHPLSTATENELDRRIKTFAGTDPKTAMEKVGGLLENVTEIVAPEAAAGKVVAATKLGKAAKVAKVGLEAATEISPAAAAATTAAKVLGHATLAAGEQGAQQLVKTGGDVEQAKQAAEAGALVGGGAAAATSLLPITSQFFKNTLRHRMGVDEFETENLVKATQAANEKIDVQAAKVHDDNIAKIKAARDAGNAADAARLEHDNVVANQQAVEAKRDNLTLAAERARAEVQQRLQTIQQSAKQYFTGAYGDLEKAAGGKGVSYSTLADGVHEALDKVKGSAESTRVFKDILARTRGIEEAQQAAGYELEDLANLAPDERERLLAHLGEEGNPAAAGASLAHLNGYYSELGRALNSPSTPGDVKQAIVSLRDFIDQQVKKELGPELYAKNQLIRSQYRRYAEGWKEYGGVAGSGSPVAMALQAKDPYNATRPFIKMAKEEEDRARGIVVGNPGEAEEQFTGKKIPERWVGKGKVTATPAVEGVPTASASPAVPSPAPAPVPLDPPSSILRAHAQLESEPNLPVSMDRLRTASHLSKQDFDSAILKLRDEGKIHLSPSHHPEGEPGGIAGLVTETNPAYLEEGILPGTKRDVHYVAATLRGEGEGEARRLAEEGKGVTGASTIEPTSTAPSLVPQGKLTPAWRYRKQTASLIEHLRNLEGGLDKLDAPEKLQSQVDKSAANLSSARTAARDLANPDLTPTPAPSTLTPAELREAKATALHTAAHNLGKFGLWVGIGGLAGGMGTFLKTGDLKKSMEIAAGGVAAGLLTPYLAAKMLDQPGVVKSLTSLSRKDLDQLMKLPPKERGDVEGAIRQLADEAVRSGRVKAAQVPWYRVIGGEVGRGMAEGKKQVAPATGTSAPAAPLPPGQYLPTPVLANPDQIDQNITGGGR